MNKMRTCLTALCAVAMAGTALDAAAREWTADASGCKVWNTQPALNEAVEWSGACVEGLAEGRGTLRWTVNGQPTRTYEGDMKAGRRSGQGVATMGRARYEGSFLDDAYAGPGSLSFHAGRSSRGEFVAGRLEGACTLTWPDNTRYDGACKAGRAEGPGRIAFASGDRYAGTLRSEQLGGQGRYQWANGDSYEGDFAGGQPAGSGSYRFADGSRYEGEFKGGRPTGRGRLELADGTGYDGQFLDGAPASPGALFKTGAAAPEDSAQLQAKLNRPYAKPLSLRAVLPVVGAMVCRTMVRPQLPVIRWKGQALYRAIATVHNGRVVEVEMSSLLPGVDPAAQKAFTAAIQRAMENYDCPGDHVFVQEFQFKLN